MDIIQKLLSLPPYIEQDGKEYTLTFAQNGGKYFQIFYEAPTNDETSDFILLNQVENILDLVEVIEDIRREVYKNYKLKSYYRAVFYLLGHEYGFAQWTTVSDSPILKEPGTGYFIDKKFSGLIENPSLEQQIAWGYEQPKEDVLEDIHLDNFIEIVMKRYKEVVGYYIQEHIEDIPIRMEIDYVPTTTREKKIILETEYLYTRWT